MKLLPWILSVCSWLTHLSRLPCYLGPAEGTKSLKDSYISVLLLFKMPPFNWKSGWVRLCVLFICSFNQYVLSILGNVLVIEYKAMGKTHKNVSTWSFHSYRGPGRCHLIICSFINGDKSHQHIYWREEARGMRRDWK